MGKKASKLEYSESKINLFFLWKIAALHPVAPPCRECVSVASCVFACVNICSRLIKLAVGILLKHFPDALLPGQQKRARRRQLSRYLTSYSHPQKVLEGNLFAVADLFFLWMWHMWIISWPLFFSAVIHYYYPILYSLLNHGFFFFPSGCLLCINANDMQWWDEVRPAIFRLVWKY